MDGLRHVPVMVDEVVAGLSPRRGDTYVDATAGDGGHAAAVAAHLGGGGLVVLNDMDASRLGVARERVLAACDGDGPRVELMHGNFAALSRRLVASGVAADMVLADLGFSSSQMEDAGRGLSFDREGPLDMRLDPSSPVTAADLVRDLPEGELARIIGEYGEERYARAVARKIAQSRGSYPIQTTSDLAKVVRSAIPRATWGRIDPATRTFQALRIAVNDEIGNLSALLTEVARGAAAVRVGHGDGGGGTWLRAGARVAIISFHSLEDRLVKRAFAEIVAGGLGMTGSGPVKASEAEVTCNPRARSATLRVLTLAG